MRLLTCLVLLLTCPPALADVWSFESPSGNIQCEIGMEIGGSDLHCVILRKNPGTDAAPRPASCGENWGHSFQVSDRGPAQLICERLQGAPGNGQFQIPYGTAENFNGIRCDSTRKGLRCSNRDGHGFFLSRARQSLF